jgi:hypothetical protein
MVVTNESIQKEIENIRRGLRSSPKTFGLQNLNNICVVIVNELHINE